MSLLSIRSIGLFAALLTVTIWALFLLTTRFAVTSKFTVEEILLLRLLPAAIAISPLLFRFPLLPRGQTVFGSLIIMIGVSAVFPYIVSSGLAYAPASDAGPLAPGMIPFWTALAAYFLIGEVPSKIRSVGLGLILIGALMVGLYQILTDSNTGAWRGHLLFLIGSGLFSIYSVIFRQSGLSPVHGLVISLFWGTVIATPLLFLSGNVTFENANLRDIIIMIVLQSFVMSILATILFNYSVRVLGAAETGAFGALTPTLTLIGGVMLLNETITSAKILGVILVALGVFLASGILNRSEIK